MPHYGSVSFLRSMWVRLFDNGLPGHSPASQFRECRLGLLPREHCVSLSTAMRG